MNNKFLVLIVLFILVGCAGSNTRTTTTPIPNCPHSEVQEWLLAVDGILIQFNTDNQVALEFLEDKNEFERQRNNAQERLEILENLNVPKCLEEPHGFLMINQQNYAEAVELFAEGRDHVAWRRLSVAGVMSQGFESFMEEFLETYLNPQT